MKVRNTHRTFITLQRTSTDERREKPFEYPYLRIRTEALSDHTLSVGYKEAQQIAD